METQGVDAKNDLLDAAVIVKGKIIRVVTLLVKAKVTPHSKTFIEMILLI